MNIARLIPALLLGIVVGVAVDAVMAYVITLNPQPKLLWDILNDSLPILTGGLTATGVLLSGTKQ